MLIVFDLDGTLIDSSRDLAISTNAVRQRFGLGPLDQATVDSYVGNGAAVLVERALGPEFSVEQHAEALAFFLQFYRSHALEHTRLYQGIGEAIHELAAARHTLAVLTNKPERISRDILEALRVASCFSEICGGNTLPFKKPDPAGLLAIVKNARASRAETLMVGDSSVDVQTARNAGVRSCGVTWGLQPESLAVCKPDYLVTSPAQLLSLAARLAGIQAAGRSS